jgi:hypothetical protein
MGEIIKPLPVRGNQGETTVQACFDSGSPNCFIRRDVSERIALPMTTAVPRIFRLADGQGTVEAREAAELNLTIKGVTVFWTFYVVDRLGDEMLIGVDMMQRWKIKLDLERDDVEIDRDIVARLRGPSFRL